jgi:predicted AAA+ superfamily ATPase
MRRTLREELAKAAQGFRSLILIGPRRAGKPTLLRHVFPYAEYVLLEDPALLNYIQSMIAGQPDRCGQWLVTGSQEAALMRGGAESMAGRAAIFP